MKKLNIKWMLSLIAAFTFASCDTDVDHDIPAVDAPVLVSTTPESGAAKVKTGEITIEVKYDKNIFFATDNLSEIKFTGGELISADVLGASNILTVKVNVPGRETACSLSIPEGIVTGPNQMPAPAVSVQFSTVALDEDTFSYDGQCCLEYGNVRKGVWMDWKISGYQLFRLCSSAGICSWSRLD